ncbi:MAG: hypothetical protein ABF979_08665 [Gluconobacter sp.]|uniref:hypothetical protein n=1 Tax=Gluconobacter sp. TaxID=1876758 RepID=UPI0039EA522A
MRSVAVCVGVVLAGATMAHAAMGRPVSEQNQLSGRYSTHFKNGDVSGDTYWSDNVLEVVPVDAEATYLRIETQFFNGHMCSLSGVGRMEGEALVYQEPPFMAGEKPCRLTVRRAGKDIVLQDADGACRAGHCGARGLFDGQTFPASSRRAITYLPRLKASREYRAALKAWAASPNHSDHAAQADQP